MKQNEQQRRLFIFALQNAPQNEIWYVEENSGFNYWSNSEEYLLACLFMSPFYLFFCDINFRPKHHVFQCFESWCIIEYTYIENGVNFKIQLQLNFVFVLSSWIFFWFGNSSRCSRNFCMSLYSVSIRRP